MRSRRACFSVVSKSKSGGFGKMLAYSPRQARARQIRVSVDNTSAMQSRMSSGKLLRPIGMSDESGALDESGASDKSFLHGLKADRKDTGIRRWNGTSRDRIRYEVGAQESVDNLVYSVGFYKLSGAEY